MQNKESKIKIINLISEIKKQEDVLVGLKTRSLDHKFCYVGTKGADKWLAMLNDPEYRQIAEANREKFFQNNLDDISKNFPKNGLNIIALGVGDGLKEKVIIEFLEKNDFTNIHYYPVDFSKELLDVAINNAKHLKCKITGVLADIKSDDFAKFIRDNFSDVKQTSLFLMLGNTFGNFHDQYGILDTLYGVLKTQDYFLFDVVIKRHNNKLDYMRDFEKNMQTIQNPKRVDHHQNYLVEELGFKKNYGHAEVRVFSTDMNNNVLKREHYFVFDRNVLVDFGGEKINFAKGERIKLQDVSWYEENYVVSFFEGHGFEVLGKYKIGTSGFFLVKIK